MKNILTISKENFAEVMANYGKYSAEAVAIILDYEKTVLADDIEIYGVEEFDLDNIKGDPCDLNTWREMTFGEALEEAEAYKIISRQDFEEIAEDEGEAVAVKTCTSLMLEAFDQCGPVYTLKNGSILWKPVV